MGYTEHILFGKKGNLPYKRDESGKIISGKSAILCEPNVRYRHSEKPEEFAKMIEKVSYPPYLELFARKKRVGWDSFGNEIQSDIKLDIGETNEE